MTDQSKRFSLLKAAAVPVAVSALIPGVAFAAFMSSSLGDIVSNGHHLLRISNGPTSGITHELTAEDGYIKFRVNVRHADATYPLIGFNSDSFDPNYGIIRICDTVGCDAPQIDAGTEDLDWTDQSKVTVRLQAKTCQLCAWDSYDVDWE